MAHADVHYLYVYARCCGFDLSLWRLCAWGLYCHRFWGRLWSDPRIFSGNTQLRMQCLLVFDGGSFCGAFYGAAAGLGWGRRPQCWRRRAASRGVPGCELLVARLFFLACFGYVVCCEGVGESWEGMSLYFLCSILFLINVLYIYDCILYFKIHLKFY